jgi:hypothetical protein
LSLYYLFLFCVFAFAFTLALVFHWGSLLAFLGSCVHL